ncbi:hypothetical protein L7F22_041850 [Adiantum nelumboides]|nr:hypothetical protein [Adiantum nelumboides]
MLSVCSTASFNSGVSNFHIFAEELTKMAASKSDAYEDKLHYMSIYHGTIHKTYSRRHKPTTNDKFHHTSIYYSPIHNTYRRHLRCGMTKTVLEPTTDIALCGEGANMTETHDPAGLEREQEPRVQDSETPADKTEGNMVDAYANKTKDNMVDDGHTTKNVMVDNSCTNVETKRNSETPNVIIMNEQMTETTNIKAMLFALQNQVQARRQENDVVCSREASAITASKDMKTVLFDLRNQVQLLEAKVERHEEQITQLGATNTSKSLLSSQEKAPNAISYFNNKGKRKMFESIRVPATRPIKHPRLSMEEKPCANVMGKCIKILKSLKRKDSNGVFLEPVDVEKYNIPDYHSIIEKPMDFGTIDKKLHNEEYQSPMQFAKDVRLTFTNAITYNPEKHWVNSLASFLLHLFEKKWRRLSSKLKHLSDFKENEVNNEMYPPIIPRASNDSSEQMTSLQQQQDQLPPQDKPNTDIRPSYLPGRTSDSEYMNRNPMPSKPKFRLQLSTTGSKEAMTLNNSLEISHCHEKHSTAAPEMDINEPAYTDMDSEPESKSPPVSITKNASRNSSINKDPSMLVSSSRSGSTDSRSGSSDTKLSRERHTDISPSYLTVKNLRRKTKTGHSNFDLRLKFSDTMATSREGSTKSKMEIYSLSKSELELYDTRIILEEDEGLNNSLEISNLHEELYAPICKTASPTRSTSYHSSKSESSRGSSSTRKKTSSSSNTESSSGRSTDIKMSFLPTITSGTKSMTESLYKPDSRLNLSNTMTRSEEFEGLEDWLEFSNLQKKHKTIAPDKGNDELESTSPSVTIHRTTSISDNSSKSESSSNSSRKESSNSGSHTESSSDRNTEIRLGYLPTATSGSTKSNMENSSPNKSELKLKLYNSRTILAESQGCTTSDLNEKHSITAPGI